MTRGLSSPVADEVKPYRIHIPSKHLDLTRQKLELTRLPHEPSHASNSNTWAPKPIIEPLIDHWLESYSWRTTESRLNADPHLPQFRTAIAPPDSQAPIRIHFIHARSPFQSAVPLLVIPPFPLPALSLAPLIPLLTGTTRTTATTTVTTPTATQTATPDDQQHQQPQQQQQQQYFHVIIPSLPGTAFSDPLPPSASHAGHDTTNPNPIPATAALLDTLMRRLGYPAYLATATAPGAGSSTAAGGAGRVGERLVRRLVAAHAASCVGGHLVCPVLRAPRRNERRGGLRGWWVAARRLLSGGGGGGGRDGGGYRRGRGRRDGGVVAGGGGGGGGGGLGSVAEADTLAYALCDSPVGMLAFLLRGLRLAAGGGKAVFTRDELVTLASLMWLPGPEGMLRFWAACGRHQDEEEEGEKTARVPKPRVAITVFAGADGSQKGKQPETTTVTAVAEEEEEEGTSLWPTPEEVATRTETYYPPAWANTLFDVVHTQRVPGPSSGLLAWEQPEVILAGVRGLAKAVLAKDARLVAVVPSTAVAVGSANTGKPAAGVPVERQKSVAVTGSSVGGSPTRAVEAVPMASGLAAQADHKGKGKDAGFLSPPVVGSSAEDESPGTLVNTPPLEETA